MILSLLSLRNFRKHSNTQLKFNNGVNYIVGGNGVGKTTILEAINYLCSTKSFNSKDSDVLRFAEEDFEIKGSFTNGNEDKARIYYSSSENKKHYFLNDKPVKKQADVIGKFPVVSLTPEDHSITLGSPSDRRKFVDSVISQASRTYLNFLLEYNRILKSRAIVLNLIRERYQPTLIDELEAWTTSLVNTGQEIIKHRLSFISAFNSYLKDAFVKIMENDEKPAIDYVYLDGAGSKNILEKMQQMIKENSNAEIKRGVNLVGPHRDEFVFTINDINLKTFGSQGQNKTFQTALRFAEFFYLKDVTGTEPLFLLDDVFGELDAYRAGKVSNYLSEIGQAFVTLTDLANFKFLRKTEEDLVIELNNDGVVYA